ncbi:MAG: AarF/ABC1/UbiB kinase family protein [Solirubrobacteraceae bacterium]|nr:AarF/ABC1/UbiB kinase family protein [Solirubrobacteraceae bacterium]
MSDQVKSGRLRRAAAMTTTAAGVAARNATAKAVTATSSSEARRTAATRQQLKSAEALVKVLGGMRGAAMKVGQTLSAVDLGLVPEEIRPEFQEILAQLQQGAKPVSFKAIRKVIEEDLGEKLSDAFASFEEEPIASASIGQVHRATLEDGRVVAVKVQYPGIADAIYADLQNLKLGLKLLSTIAPGIDTGAIADEIRERISEELDYELEATNQRSMARAYRGHPFIVVPDVVMDLCRERVIVSEYIEGTKFIDLGELTQDERNRYGEMLVRFYISGPLGHRLLNGDPHPGNVLFLDDGRMAFLDFGFFKRLGDAEVAELLASTRAVQSKDARALLDVMVGLNALPDDPALADPFLEQYDAIFGWLFVDEPMAVDPTKTADMMRRYTQLRRADGFESMTLPAEHFVLMRSVMLLIGLLGQLGASNVWLDIASEWLFDSGPRTDLGRQEAAFFGDLTPAV